MTTYSRCKQKYSLWEHRRKRRRTKKGTNKNHSQRENTTVALRTDDTADTTKSNGNTHREDLK